MLWLIWKYIEGTRLNHNLSVYYIDVDLDMFAIDFYKMILCYFIFLFDHNIQRQMP